MNRPIRVLVVDDSAFMRYSLTRFLEADPAVTVVGAARDGFDALEKLLSLRPDVVTLDVEMPRLDGLATLQHIMDEHPRPVIMFSSLTQQGARTTIQALMRGAVDFVPKPSGGGEIRAVMAELLAKIKIAAGACLAPGTPALRREAPVRSRPATALSLGDAVVIIGASTGGPRALQAVLAALPADLPAALAIVQHMAPGFTHSLAQRLNEVGPFVVKEAAPGDRLERGVALIAPGGLHMRFGEGHRVELDDGPRCNHVRPAADVTMRSAAERYGARTIGVVLTGMGQDGTAGAQAVRQAGGRVIAEHPESCVVYGMPRSVVEAGLADAVVPVTEVAATLASLVDSHGALRV
ncbi:MAG TPA: chemotaxis response regulator protein-glutamate methylesterase [Roseiflexaceae bacterium]|nr:chemotaxis response regulator protein-glutamate methylesterase [Roseiflexaceae bacterium]